MTERSPQHEGDFVTVATCATPTEAHLLKETLVAAGLTARIADANFAQANPWMANAAGGVRVLVPASLAADARKTIGEFHAGEFQLEDQDVTLREASAETVNASGSGAKTYQIYRNPKRLPAVVAVKKGFSWSAFLIGPLWFLLNGMWLTFLLSVSFTWGAPLAIQSLESPSISNAAGLQSLVSAACFAIWVFTGTVANFLLGEELKRKGYEAGPSVRARSVGEAIDASRATTAGPEELSAITARRLQL